ncbi:unnamed protein product (macronuclear) [Paramecium tetraurelia]|uniref:Transmembrane protein n=1 Tax=Paramecium tetraurelia TaxID=5888 RepID=A0BKJ7_PARTE|nr:uncharacterized protein GSPATT00029695001 [Paramecium tetraurelia]CAK59064.1 unnamed protein product [Paramecium tetraurelia]|eukprot:XP_001426462.1 hypothetical protein (macronuclear) [Paramecium tetraurelia strain d4-2]
MIIYLLFCVAHATLISQSYSIKKQEQAVVHLSIIKQFTTNYQFGNLNFNLSISANHPYTLLYIPDSSSYEYHCVAVLKLNYQDCLKENIFIEDDEYQCQQIVTSHLKQNINGNHSQLPFLICDGFQNLTISNFLYPVIIQKPETLITPAFIIYNRYITSQEGILVDFSMNLQVLQLEL